MDEVGFIKGAVKQTEFNVLLSDHKIGRGSYLKIKHDVCGWVLARIETLKRYLDDFDEEQTIARVRTIGYREGPSVVMPKTPFKPNEKVFMADDRIITSVLGLRKDRDNSIYLGLLEGHDIPVYLDSRKLIEKHMSVLAKTGAGKSYTVAVIIEELLKTDTPIVVIDPHGEYGSLSMENDDYDSMTKYDVQVHSYSSQITEYAVNTDINENAEKLSLKPDFTVMDLIGFMPIQLSDRQKGVLYSALEDLEPGRYTMKDLIRRIDEEPTKLKWKILEGLESLQVSGVFDGTPVDYGDLVKPGRAAIINLKGVDPHVQQLVVARMTKDLFEQVSIGRLPKLFYLVEEAHNFCPERGFGNVMSSEIFRTIASEGRKFGFRLGVVSQRPARIDKNVLSQCNTQVILTVTNPNDLKAIGQSIEGFTPGMEDEIKELRVGYAMVVGDCVEQPIIVDVRARETKHGGKYVPKPGDEKKKPPKYEKKRPGPKGSKAVIEKSGGLLKRLSKAFIGLFVEFKKEEEK
ncbi:MAG: ATP-binding protein [Candidatus Altiarchaeota archaeon]